MTRMESLRPAGVAVSSTDNQKSVRSVGQSFGAELGHNLGRDTNRPIDFDFLVAQTFADAALEREVLQLFVAQVRKILPMPAGADGERAGRYSASSQGVGIAVSAPGPRPTRPRITRRRRRRGTARRPPRAEAAPFAAAEAAIAARLATALDLAPRFGFLATASDGKRRAPVHQGAASLKDPGFPSTRLPIPEAGRVASSRTFR